MKQLRKSPLLVAGIPLAFIPLAGILTAMLWAYTTLNLEVAKREGVYPNPEAAMRVRVSEGWVGIERVEITYAGPNSFDGSDPHVWFVTAQVWATRRADWKPVHQRGYDSAGSFFLRVREGWVHVPEGRFPELIGLGMRLFGPWVEI